MNLNKENMKKIRHLILFTVLLFVALSNVHLIWTGVTLLIKMLTPFLIGGAIAFVLGVPMGFIEKNLFVRTKISETKWGKKIARPVSMLLAFVFVIGIIAIVMFVVLPELGNTALNIGKSLQSFVPKVQEWAIRVFKDNPEVVAEIKQIEFDWDKIFTAMIDFLKDGAVSVVGGAYAAAVSIVNGVTSFVIAIVFAIYILLQKERLCTQTKKLLYAFIPRDWANILIALGGLTHKTFSNFLTGQCMEAVILGMLFLVAMNIFQLPYAMLISIFIGFMALIPIFGAFIGCAVGALLIFIVAPAKALVFIIMFLIIQQIEGNLIYPHVVGNSVGLPSIWVLVAVSVGASLMGVVGMLIFIPIVSVIYTILRGIVNRRVKERQIDL